MVSAKKTSERKKEMPATRIGRSKNSEERPPDTVEREKPITSETQASVEGKSREGTLKAVTGQMPLTSDMSVSLVGSSGSVMGQMSAARGSAESNRPGKGSPLRDRSLLGLEEKELSVLPQENVEEFGEFLHEGKPKAVPKLQPFKEDDMLKRPPPDFVLDLEH